MKFHVLPVPSYTESAMWTYLALVLGQPCKLYCTALFEIVLMSCCYRRWNPKVARHAPKKVKAHTAMSDIKESLKELAYYKTTLFKNK